MPSKQSSKSNIHASGSWKPKSVVDSDLLSPSAPSASPPPHPFLSPSQIAKAHAVFSDYCAAGSTIPRGSQAAPAGMNAKAVQLFLSDIGVVVTDSEAKDIIYTLNQSSAVTNKNREVDLIEGIGASGRTTVTIPPLGSADRTQPPSTTPPPEDGSAAAAAGSTLGPSSSIAAGGGGGGRTQLLSFPLFLELMLQSHHTDSATRDAELKSAFCTMDNDSDSNISAADVKAIVAKYLIDNPDNVDLKRLAAMSAEELSRVVQEADMDGDGRVSLEDFVRVMTTS